MHFLNIVIHACLSIYALLILAFNCVNLHCFLYTV
jgi:hypothetical protein